MTIKAKKSIKYKTNNWEHNQNKRSFLLKKKIYYISWPQPGRLRGKKKKERERERIQTNTLEN